MLIPFGVLSAAGAGGIPFESDYELIESTILTSNQASVTFSSLGTYSSTYKHLQIRAVVKTNGLFDSDAIRLRFNSDTGSNYAYHTLVGNGSSVTSTAATSQTGAGFGLSGASKYTGAPFGSFIMDILDVYATKNKTIRLLTGYNFTDDKLIALRSSVWLNTASVTTLTLNPVDGTNLLTGSRFSLYGIRG